MTDVLKEHQFWLQIMADHTLFLRGSIHPKETRELEITNQLLKQFQYLTQKAHALSRNNVIAFTKEAESAVDQLKTVKLTFIKGQLIGNIVTSLSPTLLNHMINELEEYERVMNYLKEGIAPPVFHELHHHLLWLPTIAVHAEILHDSFDKVETALKKRSNQFSIAFDQAYVKAVELTGYLRANIHSFPVLSRFNQEAEREVQLFQQFLHEIKEMEQSNMVLGAFPKALTDHIIREVHYYFLKQRQSTRKHN